MALWKSKTDLWGRKTRPVKFDKIIDEALDEKEEDYLEEDKIKTLEAKIVFLTSMLDKETKEVARLNKRLEESTDFTHKVILELISRPPANNSFNPAPKTALEKYIEKKNGETSKGKLP